MINLAHEPYCRVTLSTRVNLAIAIPLKTTYHQTLLRLIANSSVSPGEKPAHRLIQAVLSLTGSHRCVDSVSGSRAPLAVD